MGNDEMKEIFRDFDGLAIKEKLDTAVSLAEQYNANAASGAVKFAQIGRITVKDNIESAAAASGAELQRYKGASGDVRHSFLYKGWEFVQYTLLVSEGG